jgi:hypothetical protein
MTENDKIKCAIIGAVASVLVLGILAIPSIASIASALYYIHEDQW